MKSRHLLTRAVAWVLADAVPRTSSRDEWRLLYASDTHGKSYAACTSKIEDQGPVLVLVSSTTGRKFGGFCGGNLTKKSGFFGDSSSFVYSISPMLALYKASGHNTNFVYFAHGFTADRFPNGIGLGGVMGNFVFFIASNLEYGHTRGKMATFHPAPCLSGAESNFEIDGIEVWAVTPPSEEKQRERKSGASVLSEKYREEKMLLAFASRDQGGPGREER